jgi:hypothetical protein
VVPRCRPLPGRSQPTTSQAGIPQMRTSRCADGVRAARTLRCPELRLAVVEPRSEGGSEGVRFDFEAGRRRLATPRIQVAGRAVNDWSSTIAIGEGYETRRREPVSNGCGSRWLARGAGR